MILDNFEIKEEKGHGAFGRVFVATDKSTGENVAIKEISKNYLYQNPKNYNDFMRELKAIQTIKSDNSVKYIDLLENEACWYIVMELCDIDLENYLIKIHVNPFSTEEIREIFSQLNNAFREMRKFHLIHRDIKLGNILLKFLDQEKKTYIAKLSDFGLCRTVNKDSPMSVIGVGDLTIKAPEICYSLPYNEKCDLWSIGVSMYYLYFRQLPIGLNPEQYFNAFISNIQNSYNMDLQLKDLLSKLLVVDQAKRISWDDYFNHPFFKGDGVGIETKRYSRMFDFNVGYNYNKELFDCYVAKDNIHNKNVLIKSYKLAFVNDKNITSLFNNEIYLFRQFKGNKNVLKLIDEYYDNEKAFFVFDYNDFEILANYSIKKEMEENEIKKINKILFNNVLIFNENVNISFNFISIYSFCIDKEGNPLLFDFGIHKLFLSNEELSIYFYPSPIEFKLYYINPIKTNVMNYGMTLLLLLSKNKWIYKDEKIILPKNASEEFRSFLSKCLNMNFNERCYWQHLYSEKFILEDSAKVGNKIDDNVLLDNDKLEMIINSLKKRFSVIINYYDKLDIENNIECIDQIKLFIFISLYEAKIIFNFFNRKDPNASFSNKDEISFISLKDNGEKEMLNLNFGNPILRDTQIIKMTNNKLIKDFIEEITKYIERFEEIFSKVDIYSDIQINENCYANNIIESFEKSLMQEYFFKVITDGEKEKNKSNAYNEFCLAEYFCEFILFIHSTMYEKEEINYFYKEDFLEKFYQFFGDDKKSIFISNDHYKNNQKRNILISFIGILFKDQKNEIKQKVSLNKDLINGVIEYYPILMKKINNLKPY